jgi:hypothetical protein
MLTKDQKKSIRKHELRKKAVKIAHKPMKDIPLTHIRRNTN